MDLFRLTERCGANTKTKLFVGLLRSLKWIMLNSAWSHSPNLSLSSMKLNAWHPPLSTGFTSFLGACQPSLCALLFCPHDFLQSATRCHSMGLPSLCFAPEWLYSPGAVRTSKPDKHWTPLWLTEVVTWVLWTDIRRVHIFRLLSCCCQRQKMQMYGFLKKLKWKKNLY